jgi:hypothetical protein
MYDNNQQGFADGRDAYDPQPARGDRDARAGYRPGWIWIPVVVVSLLIVLVIAVGFVYGGGSSGLRGYDDGTRIEQTQGDTTQPGTAPIQGAPELGNQPEGEERSSLPEAAPALSNDGR